MKLEIPNANLAAFLGALGLGTLEAIRAGTVPPSAGTWTLATPRMLDGLAGLSRDVDEVLEVFQSCDELEGIQELLPEQFEAKLDGLIGRLRAVLQRQPERIWEVDWHKE
jgi:hypothetical protein